MSSDRPFQEVGRLGTDRAAVLGFWNLQLHGLDSHLSFLCGVCTGLFSVTVL